MVYDKEFGICFSGGGARSASFCSGVLCQLIHRHNMEKSKPETNEEEIETFTYDKVSLGHQLPKYFSCVSGGGYVGSSFLHWARHHKDKKISDWSGEYFKQFHTNISYIISCNAGCEKGLRDIVFCITFVSLWFVSIVLEIMCETFIFYKFVAYMVWPLGLTSSIEREPAHIRDWNYTFSFHFLNENRRPVSNPANYIFVASMICMYLLCFAIKIWLQTKAKNEYNQVTVSNKCSFEIASICFQTVFYFFTTFGVMYVGVLIAAVLHYTIGEHYSFHYFWLYPVCLIIVIMVNVLIIKLNRKLQYVPDHKIDSLTFDLYRIVSMLLGGHLIFWNVSYYDKEEVFIYYFFSNNDWFYRYDQYLYVCLFFPYLVYFVQNAFSEFWEARLKIAFYKDFHWAVPKLMCALCCRRSCRKWENQRDWIYDDGDDTGLPIYDSVCTGYWQRPGSIGDSTIMTFSSDGGWYAFQSCLSNESPYSNKWYNYCEVKSEKIETTKLEQIGTHKLRLSKVMALSGGALSLWMGSYFAGKSHKENIFKMFDHCFTHFGASMGGWIRTTKGSQYDPLFLIVMGPLFMAPIILMIKLAGVIVMRYSSYLAVVSWFVFFVMYFIIWNFGRMGNSTWVKLFEYFYYPFKLNFLIGRNTWITNDPPIDRVYLSDGGHKDNYALASLILRRRCKKILICEGSEYDPPLDGLLQAFYWSDYFSDVFLEFYFYNKEGLWKKVDKELYEDFFQLDFFRPKKNPRDVEKKNPRDVEKKNPRDVEKKIRDLKKGRKEFSETVLGGKGIACGKSPYCWMFKVKYGGKKYGFKCSPGGSVEEKEYVNSKYSPCETIKEAFLWFVAPPIDGKLVHDGKLKPKSHCEDHIIKDGNLDTHNLSGCCCDCCHTKTCYGVKCCHTKTCSYPHFSTLNQVLTPSQNSALHVAGTLAAEKALALNVNRGVGFMAFRVE